MCSLGSQSSVVVVVVASVVVVSGVVAVEGTENEQISYKIL